MTDLDHEMRDTSDSLGEWSRKIIDESSALRGDSLEFLGRPTLGLRRGPQSGASPGKMIIPSDAPEPVLHLMSFGPDRLDELVVDRAESCRELVATEGQVAWLDVEGFGNQRTLEVIGEQLGIHPLAMADVVHIPQRPKAELYGDRLLVITQMAQVTETGEILIEQVSFVLGPGWVVSFQERPGDVFDPIRQRIRSTSTRIRGMGPDYLLYALIDAVIDGYFEVVESMGAVVEALEDDVVDTTSFDSLTRLHAARRTLMRLHRVQWRQRDAVSSLMRDEEFPISDSVKPYLRDAHDHAFQTLDAIESYRDMVSGLMDLHLSRSSHRMNEIMKALTIVSTIFIPLTFMAGVYGMNFDYMPELRMRTGYALFWVATVLMGVGFLAWFRRRGWIGGGRSAASRPQGAKR